MKWKITHKFFIILNGVALFTLFPYFMFAINSFEQDKIAYTYSAGIGEVKHANEIFENNLLFIYDWKNTISSATLEQSKRALITDKIDGRIERIMLIDEENITDVFTRSMPRNKILGIEKTLNLKQPGLYLRQYDGRFYLLYIDRLDTDPKNRLFAFSYYDDELIEILSQQDEKVFYFINHNINVYTDAPALEENSLKIIIDKIKSTPGQQGAYESQITGQETFVNYAINKRLGFTTLLLIEKDHLFERVNQFKTRSVFFAIIIVGILGLISIFISHVFTKGINKLSLAASTVSDGDYNVDLHVTSNDEIGNLALAFKSMISKIKKQISEIEEYNLILEEKVKGRTRELQEAMNLQSAMMNSVSQAFLMFDEHGAISPIYSNFSTTVFGPEFSRKNVSEVLFSTAAEREDFNAFCRSIFTPDMPVSDLLQILPNYLVKSQRHLFFNYFPLYEESKLTHVIVVATDKTDEVVAKNDFEKQYAYTKMIQKITVNKFNFIDFVKRLSNFTQEKSRDIALAHTLKGLASFYHLDAIKSQLHKIEEKNATPETYNSLAHDLTKLLESSHEILGIENLLQAQVKKEIALDSVHRIRTYFDQRDFERAEQDFHQYIELDLLLPKLKRFESYSKELAQSLNKKLHFEYDEALKHAYIDAEKCAPLLESFIHIFRNIVDHGIESEEERKNAHKNPNATIRLNSKLEKNSLSVIIEDDGRGLDLESLRSKLREHAKLNEEQLSDDFVANNFFRYKLSTTQTVTDLSGRGEGLNAVVKEIDLLGGQLHISTKAGQGTLFTIHVPTA